MRSPLSWLPFVSGMVVLVLSLGVAVVVVTNRSTSQDIRSQAAATTGTLSLSPALGNYTFSANQTYPVGIVVDSKNTAIDGVDVIIKFDPKKAAVSPNSLVATGLFERVVVSQIDNTAGVVRFSALTFSPKPATGIAATFNFKALGAGTVGFTFDFTPGATTDSNIAEHGTAKDILSKVENATFNFN